MAVRGVGDKPKLGGGGESRVLRRSIAIAILLVFACRFVIAQEYQATVVRRTTCGATLPRTSLPFGDSTWTSSSRCSIRTRRTAIRT